jgi:hypothetical protein
MGKDWLSPLFPCLVRLAHTMPHSLLPGLPSPPMSTPPLLSPGRPPPPPLRVPRGCSRSAGLPLALCPSVSAPSSHPGRLDLHIPPHAPSSARAGWCEWLGLADSPALASAFSSIRYPPRLCLTLLPLGSFEPRFSPCWPLPFPAPVPFGIISENDPNPARNWPPKRPIFSQHFKLFPAAQGLPAIAKRHISV